MTRIAFTNETFNVVVLDSEELALAINESKPYAVVNKEFDVIDYRAENLVEALSAAEQFNYMLLTEAYRAPVEGKSPALELVPNTTNTEH